MNTEMFNDMGIPPPPQPDPHHPPQPDPHHPPQPDPHHPPQPDPHHPPKPDPHHPPKPDPHHPPKPDPHHPPQPKHKKANTTSGYILLGLGLLYSVLGLIAFVKSILCFSANSSTSEKIIGFILAILFGPFYFLYYYLNPKYCKSPIPFNTNRRNAGNNRRNVSNNKRMNRNNANKRN